MNAYKPSADFVARVMESVYACEARKARRTRFSGKLIAYSPLRWAVSVSSVFSWVLFSPTICI